MNTRPTLRPSAAYALKMAARMEPDYLRELANAIEANGAACFECGATTMLREEFRGWCPFCGAEMPHALGDVDAPEDDE